MPPNRPARTRRALAAGALAGALLALGGCVAYPAGAPAAYPSTFDRAFDAALGAMSTHGLSIATQDRASGVIVGRRGGMSLTASVRPQADGTTRVTFDQSGSADPDLVQRVVADYNRRMGR